MIDELHFARLVVTDGAGQMEGHLYLRSFASLRHETAADHAVGPIALYDTPHFAFFAR